MDDQNGVADPHDVIPTSCEAILALAEKSVKRYWADPTILNLYPMALLSSHAVDWYVEITLGRRMNRQITEQFAQAYPVWDAIRSIGNGLKHAKVEAVATEQFATEHMHFEHQGWWAGKAYGALYEDRMVPVDALCFQFVQEFSGDLSTGRIKSRLPKLHSDSPAG